ncbi:serine/arginine repetitive matrix protein 1-like [Acanthochromis polyacanthus]|uniref:serine/arginine repetitive matrix protein 1-like n=1 Tax=Acanthochromis polyacanthus TaxID=80966 RepID=UPI002234AB3F|nr:serine/arginine repetitive matrix protein 1-like [Acanthochromis polyacanthus]
MDNFDSEMQEWEDQLQDIQRKIEELYNEVQARRGANDVAADNQRNGVPLECGLGHRGDAHPAAISVPHHYSNGYGANGYPPAGRQNGCSCRHPSGVSEIGDLLQDYLGKGKQTSRKNNGARHVHFSDTIRVSQDVSENHDAFRRASGNERLGPDQFLGSFEETENRKNRVSHMKSSPNKENAGAKPPLGQRDAPVAPPTRSQLESPALDRKSFGPGVLGDRKCVSPSVLRKFGAMLQENEGKTLTESGVVAPQGPEPKSPTPGCQRRGAAASPGRLPGRVPAQKCQADCDVLTAELEPSQERGAVDSSRQRGSRASQQWRSPSTGSPNIRPRTNSSAGDGARRPTEPKMDYRASSLSSGAQRMHRGGLAAPELRDEGLIELLDMLEIQHEFSSGPRNGYAAYRQEVNSAEMSPVRPKKSFSRPARPANQRPPSRWAARTPAARIAAPSGPIYRPPSPMTRTPSPASRRRNLVPYSLQTETVIM